MSREAIAFNLKLPGDPCSVDCFGYGGLLVDSDPHNRLYKACHRFTGQDIILLHIASNDLANGVPARKVVDDLLEFANAIHRRFNTKTMPKRKASEVDDVEENTAAHLLLNPVLAVNAAELFSSQSQTSGISNSYAQPKGLSISRHVSDLLKADIWADKFVNFALLLTGSFATQLALNITETEDDEPTLRISSAPKSKVLTFDQWHKAFGIFMGILLQKDPLCAQSLLAYSSLLSELFTSYGIKVVHFYDSQFWLLRQSGPYPWDQIHFDLWLRATTLHGPMANKTPPPSSHNPSISRSLSCFNFNSQLGCRRKRCKYSHVCSKCGYNHPVSRCYSNRQDGSSSSMSTSRSPNTNPILTSQMIGANNNFTLLNVNSFPVSASSIPPPMMTQPPPIPDPQAQSRYSFRKNNSSGKTSNPSKSK
ncbi:hypothetical protein LOTGIDRAFT_153152 [Lottia gigantea]|uniref:C3H1-type domain-containing protein n=1 Tax=Lottia gigantea TaxID=225164 RepID=V4AAA4_LOTGI|nr:hypothetical protein LOTGIDRAFT_153152 [Lottia gigantea]ESO93697.1 hypothetical protein LOTGIDRAFT_153152 [Lottia gigantea]